MLCYFYYIINRYQQTVIYKIKCFLIYKYLQQILYKNNPPINPSIKKQYQKIIMIYISKNQIYYQQYTKPKQTQNPKQHIMKKPNYPYILFQILFVLTILITLTNSTGIISKEQFQLQCTKPFMKKQMYKSKPYGLVLTSGQKNIEIYFYVGGQGDGRLDRFQQINKNDKEKLNYNRNSQKKAQQITKQQSQQPPIPIKPQCTLSKDNKICIFDKNVKQLYVSCNNNSTAELEIVQLNIVQYIGESQPFTSQLVAFDLEPGEKAVATFKSDIFFKTNQIWNNQIFITNCIESIEFFEHEIIIGVKGLETSFQVIMVGNQDIVGEWVFQKVNYVLGSNMDVVNSYNMALQQNIYEIQNTQLLNNQQNNKFYGFQILIMSQNRTFIKQLQLNFTVSLNNDNTLTSEQQLYSTILIKSGQLQKKIPIKLYFYYSSHEIKKIMVTSNLNFHYRIHLSKQGFGNGGEAGSGSQSGEYKGRVPKIQEDQYLFYSFQEYSKQIFVELEVSVQSRSMRTSNLTVISQGINNISGELIDYRQIPLNIKNNQVQSLKFQDSSRPARISLSIQPSKSTKQKPIKKSEIKYFKLLFYTSYIPIQINIGQKIREILFKNEQKRFLISKYNIQICNKCNAFLTYNLSCTDINCCEYSYAQQIDVKPESLYIITTNKIRMERISEIDILLVQDQKAFKLEDGEIMEGILFREETFVFQYDGKEDVEIIINSPIQTILILVNININQFPNKKSFDLQSNEGYIKIPAPKIKKTIYITLLKMSTTFLYLYDNYKIPYSIVIVSESGKFKLLENKVFDHSVKKKSVNQYILSQPCNSEETIYLRIHTKMRMGLGVNKKSANPSLIRVSIFDTDSQKLLLVENATQYHTIEVTKYFQTKRSSLPNNPQKQPLLTNYTQNPPKPIFKNSTQQICYIRVSIQNLLQQNLDINIMYFKQKQIYQIHEGKFVKDKFLSGQKLMLYCTVNAMKDTNVYVFSLSQEISLKTTLISVGDLHEVVNYFQLDVKESYSNKNRQINGNKNNVYFKILDQRDSKYPSHSQYIFIPALKTPTPNTTITVVLIQIQQKKQNQDFQSKQISIICTHNNTELKTGSKLQYRTLHEKMHKFKFALFQELMSDKNQYSLNQRWVMNFNNKKNDEKEIVLQTIRFDGNYNVKAKMTYKDQNVCQFQNENKNANKNKNIIMNSKKFQNLFYQKASQSNFIQGQPLFILSTQQVRQKLVKYTQKNSLTLQTISYKNLFLEFQITCIKQNDKYCSFLTSLQTSQSDVRQLTPGIPQAFHMNKHSSVIFIYNNNLRDQQFKFKINRKLGFPNYKLCSSRPKLKKSQRNSNTNIEYLDKCLQDLQNSNNELNLKIEQDVFNLGQNFVAGRSHELIIKRDNQHYCINCTYYLALYSEYEIVEGSVFIMSASQTTYLEQANSITTIVNRGEPDTYLVTNWESLMGVIYQIQGSVQVQVYQLTKQNNNQNQNNKKKIIFNKNSLQTNNTSQRYKKSKDNNTQADVFKNNNILTIDLQQYKSSTSTHNQSQQLQGLSHEYYIRIQPANMLPSALYTLVIVSKRQQVINIKDGVPYEMKYSNQNQNYKEGVGLNNGQKLNPIVNYRYICQNQGVVMIKTKHFQDIDIQVRCQDQFFIEDQISILQTESIQQKQKQNTKKPKNKLTQGKLIDINSLLKTREYNKMSNHLDINISPKTCKRYQISITAKITPVTYSIQVSSTDIITLPLHKQVSGVLRYQTKIFQIYEILVNQKTQLRISFKFCEGGDGRIMIAQSKSNVYDEIYYQEIQIYEESTVENMMYLAKPGLFYIKIQFKGRSGNLEYTLHIEKVGQQSFTTNSSYNQQTPLKIYKNQNEIAYKVVKIGSNYTQYNIQFYQIVQNSNLFIYEIQYYIVESTKLKLLKKTQNCNGQYFVELVNHHQEIKQTKINIDQSRYQDKGQSATKQNQQQQEIEKDIKKSTSASQLELQPQQSNRHKISISYTTTTPYTYITIIPIIYNKKTHEFYHLYVPKYRQIQLKNGQLFSTVTYALSLIASKIQEFVDIHSSENVVLGVISVIFCGWLGLCLVGGVWVGSRYFFKVKTVYVLKEIRQDQNQDQVQQNRIQVEGSLNSLSGMIIRQEINSQQQANQNQPQNNNTTNIVPNNNQNQQTQLNPSPQTSPPSSIEYNQSNIHPQLNDNSTNILNTITDDDDQKKGRYVYEPKQQEQKQQEQRQNKQ